MFWSSPRASANSADEAGRRSSATVQEEAPPWRHGSALVRQGIEIVAAQPALNLRACLAHRLGHRGDVAAVLAEQGDDLLATCPVVGRKLSFRQAHRRGGRRGYPWRRRVELDHSI